MLKNKMLSRILTFSLSFLAVVVCLFIVSLMSPAFQAAFISVMNTFLLGVCLLVAEQIIRIWVNR
jgi:hypothetical protein